MTELLKSPQQRAQTGSILKRLEKYSRMLLPPLWDVLELVRNQHPLLLPLHPSPGGVLVFLQSRRVLLTANV